MSHNSDPFATFDDAGDGFNMFDDASGATSIPAGWYVAKLERGEATFTKANKPCYRLRFAVTEGPHIGFALWRYYTFTDMAAANRAKAALAPLKLHTAADLRTPIPAPGRTIICRVLAAIQTRPDGTLSNDVQRFEIISDETAPPSPFAVDVGAPGEGGAS